MYKIGLKRLKKYKKFSKNQKELTTTESVQKVQYLTDTEGNRQREKEGFQPSDLLPFDLIHCTIYRHT